MIKKLLNRINWIQEHTKEKEQVILLHGEEVSVVKEALESRKAKKPVLKKHTNRVPDEQNVYYCPCCGEWSSDMIRFAFCPDCGQAIDWSDSVDA